MDQPLAYRLAFIVLLVAVRLARMQSRRQTGWRANWPAMKNHAVDTAVLIAVSLCWLAGVVLFVFLFRQIAAFDVRLPATLRWSAFGAGLVATWLLRWADRTLGENLSVTLQIKQSHTLVTSGPYRWIRHPIYASGLLFAVAMGVMAANIIVGMLFIVPMLVLAALRIPAEERMMADHFGEAYQQYMRRTGRVLPRIWSRS